MAKRAERFVLHFTMLFLVVLLAMCALFLFMRANHGKAIPGGVLDFGEAFRVNLFMIDLSLLLILESLLILIFVRHTAPALIASSCVVIVLAVAGGSLIGHETTALRFARLVSNEYAALGLRDVLMLFLLNGLLIAFMVAMMHHYQEAEIRQAAAGPVADDSEATEPPGE